MTRSRWGLWGLICLVTALAVSIALHVGPDSGWLSAVAVLAGGLAYAMMAINLLLASRRPILERLFGPLDRIYTAHRVIGSSILAVIGLHLVLIPIASAVDRGVSLLENLSVAVPLGVVGLLLLAGSIALSLNPKVAYDRWQRVHAATGAAFLLLTAHMALGANAWIGFTGPAGFFLGCFAVLGIVSFLVRLVDKTRGGMPYVVVATSPRERGLEVVMKPEGTRALAGHRPGQFAFLAASNGTARETHPFTLTSPHGSERVGILIRSSGDWTAAAQAGIAVGDRVRLDGPFGAFTPRLDAPTPQVWIAGGAGITPFLSVLRTARESGGDHRGQVELIVAAHEQSDAPCWSELSEHARHLPWLTLTPAFAADGGRLDRDTIRRHVDHTPKDADWYLCGPPALVALVNDVLRHAGTDASHVHTERYQWRSASRSER